MLHPFRAFERVPSRHAPYFIYIAIPYLIYAKCTNSRGAINRALYSIDAGEDARAPMSLIFLPRRFMRSVEVDDDKRVRPVNPAGDRRQMAEIFRAYPDGRNVCVIAFVFFAHRRLNFGADMHWIVGVQPEIDKDFLIRMRMRVAATVPLAALRIAPLR